MTVDRYHNKLILKLFGGSEDTWTTWIPLGDCPRSLGSLAVLPGSHKQGMMKVEQADGAGGHACVDTPAEGWVRADFSCGDILFLHSHLLHQGQDNTSADQLRLSVDLRCQNPQKPIHESSLEPHLNYLSWEEIYQNWPQNDPVKYYWKKEDLDIVEE